MDRPEIAVVVASHDRPVRLRWLLDALERQTLARDRFEIVVAHDSCGQETERLLRNHALARARTLRHVTLSPGSAPPGANRNAAWRSARAPLIAFTDDDCLPPPQWLEALLAVAAQHPGAVTQGATRPHPDEVGLLMAPHSHTQDISPPTPWVQACNACYPRKVLERLGGFDEMPLTGEDADLAARARRAGAAIVAAPEALTHHAVVAIGLPARLRGIWRWKDLARLVARNPELRADLPLRIFWKPSHPLALLCLLGCALGCRKRSLAVLALPWVAHRLPSYGSGARGRARAAAELPGRLTVDIAEVVALARGSAEHRSLLL